MASRYTRILMVVAVGLALAPAARASTIVWLNDLNSDVQFVLDADDPTTETEGMVSWLIDEVERMERQWFWFRLGDTGPERQISELAYQNHNAIDLNGEPGKDVLWVRYLGEGLQVDVTVTLVGGGEGSGKSDIAETIRITNVSCDTLDLNFFQYADFELGGEETVEVTGASGGEPGNTVYQQGAGGGRVAETVVTRSNHTLAYHQAGLQDGSDLNDILKALTDGDADDLTDASGPLSGDAVWGFQWQAELEAGDTLIISKDKNVVPEPATVFLMAAGTGLALVMRRRRR